MLEGRLFVIFINKIELKMSRIGNSPIVIPEGVNVSIEDQIVTVKGKLGELVQKVNLAIKVIIAEYLKVSDFFIQSSQKDFLNAILDKVSKVSRIDAQ